jgi:hypothetical protein
MNAESGSGAYVRQPGGYQAFIPRGLPATEPPVVSDDELRNLLSVLTLALVQGALGNPR